MCYNYQMFNKVSYIIFFILLTTWQTLVTKSSRALTLGLKTYLQSQGLESSEYWSWESQLSLFNRPVKLKLELWNKTTVYK